MQAAPLNYNYIAVIFSRMLTQNARIILDVKIQIHLAYVITVSAYFVSMSFI
jgi:hypothetical protein